MAGGRLHFRHPGRKSINREVRGAGASQFTTGRRREQMSLRKKPLVRFDSVSRAQLVSGPSIVGASATSSEPRRGKSSMPARRRSTGRKRRTGSSKSTKPRLVKGRVNVRVAGYLGVQKLAPSKLIRYIPANKLKVAAKKVLASSGGASRRSGAAGGSKRRRRRGKGRKKSKRRRRRRRTAATSSSGKTRRKRRRRS